MPALSLSIFLLFLLNPIFGQTCVHNDLSGRFRITTRAERTPANPDPVDTPLVKVTITDKVTRQTQVITFRAVELYNKSFSKCNLVRSYTTGKNKKAAVTDLDFGDLVVADYNFDSCEDIAVKCDDENSGTYYRFYVQGKDHSFTLDSFLTDSMSIIPTRFNYEKKTLTTYQRAGARYMGEQVYRLDQKKNKWSLIRHRFLE